MNKSDNMQQKSNLKIIPRSPLTSQKQPSSEAMIEDSTSYLSSNYIRYLNHLSAEEPSVEDDDYHVYWNLVTKSLLYLKRESLNDEYHDEIMFALFKTHFDMKKLDPTPVTDIGSQLLRCGYFLAAYAILLVRLRGKGKDLIDYFQIIYSKYKVSYGEAELRWYLSGEYSLTSQILASSKGGSSKLSQKPYVRTSTCDTSFSL